MNVIFVHVVVGVLAFMACFVLGSLAKFFSDVAFYWYESALTERFRRECDEDAHRCRMCEIKVRCGK